MVFRSLSLYSDWLKRSVLFYLIGGIKLKDKTPLYYYSASYAREHGELEQYRASYKANVACKQAIENAIADNYRDNCLGLEAVQQVLKQFDYERIFYVLANTVRQKDWDGRFSYDNKTWARTIPVYEDSDGFGGDRNVYFVVDRSHPVLTDMFLTNARHEYLLTRPLKTEDIQKEAQRLLGRLQSEREPNSPSGTHFMAEVSKDFMHRARSKDTERLAAMLPFASLALTTLKDRTGVYAIISGEEDRNKPLQKRRPSVRNRLNAQTSQPALSTAPAQARKKEPER